LADLPLYRHLHLFREIINGEQATHGWKPSWDGAMRDHPESRSAEYDLVVNSKPYFLFNASVCAFLNFLRPCHVLIYALFRRKILSTPFTTHG